MDNPKEKTAAESAMEMRDGLKKAMADMPPFLVSGLMNLCRVTLLRRGCCPECGRPHEPGSQHDLAAEKMAKLEKALKDNS